MTPSADADGGDRRTALLSNGRYGVLVRADGSGWSRWQGLALTRWRESAAAPDAALHLLLRDEASGERWSATCAAVDAGPDPVVADFGIGRAAFSRRVGGIETRVDVAVAAEGDVELRRLVVRNPGAAARELSVTAFAEAVVGSIGGDDAHPAFSKMFVDTAWDEDRKVLLATRRRRSAADPSAWVACVLHGPGEASHETDRLRFLGRGRRIVEAAAMAPGGALSGTVGCVLDPVLALRRRFAVAAGSAVELVLRMAAAATRDEALALVLRADPPAVVIEHAVRQAVAEHARLAIAPDAATRFDAWLAPLVVADPRCRASAEAIARARGGAAALRRVGVSGERPVALVSLALPNALDAAADLLRAQDDWRSKRFAVDVVLLNTARGAVADVLHAALEPMARAQRARHEADGRGLGVEVVALRADALDAVVRDALCAAARLRLGGDAAAVETVPTLLGGAPRVATEAAGPRPADFLPVDAAGEFGNGTGAFVDEGRAYRIDLDDGRTTPAPWINVIAQPLFGCMASADGGGHTWSVNSQQNPLTPWPNDPVVDPPQETLYLRDADTGVLWTATAAPIRRPGARYAAVHGKGFTRFETDAQGLDAELVVTVAADEPVKRSRLRLANRSTRPRRLVVTGLVRWALGPNGSLAAPFVVTSREPATGALLARNAWRDEHGERVAFVDLGDPAQALAGDLDCVLGPSADPRRPAALAGAVPLDGRVGTAVRPCGAVQVAVELPPQTRVDLVWLLGDAPDAATARRLVERHRAIDADAQIAAATAGWREILDTVRVTTPDRALDLLLNDWLLYQVLASRVWARTAYYQSSGAYGFRDQFQDVMALLPSRPDLAREHVLRAVGRQFAEGDVQHWWQPPRGQGIRTRISDDRGWLVLLTLRYVEATGDRALLDVEVPFLTGPAVPPGEPEAFFLPGTADAAASVYEHCAIALDASLAAGAHGLPLMQTGDWNDGMNRVGEGGRGESVWLGWLLGAAIDAFAPVADARGDAARAARWRTAAAGFRAACEAAWDGAWYRRGYYDDGTPLGSASSDACCIDSLAQSWSVIAAADPSAPGDRPGRAMASVEQWLVDPVARVSKLFTPPFDSHSAKDPGYVKGYPPGIRENGGQYTHGACWTVFAWAGLGDGRRAHAAFDLLNPVRHAATAADAARYRVEPYVVCADVYGEPPHLGRGGWTWYTGSAAWLYRAGLEAVLGVRLAGQTLQLRPCIPPDWPGYRVEWRRRAVDGPVTVFRIEVENPNRSGGGVARIEVDGAATGRTDGIALFDDGRIHAVRVVLR